MKPDLASITLAGLLIGPAVGLDVPQNVRNLYNSIRAQGSCKNQLKGGFYSQEGDSKSEFS
jgi:hypothetical protein